MKRIAFILLFYCIPLSALFSQFTAESLTWKKDGTASISGLVEKSKHHIVLEKELPLFSVLVDGKRIDSRNIIRTERKQDIQFVVGDSILVRVKQIKGFSPGIKYSIRFYNESNRTRKIENLVPLGEGPDKVYITAGGTKDWPHYLCRSLLYRPGVGPIGVILPDNAWHLGYADIRVNDSVSVTALARRGDRDKERSELDRWTVSLKPQGWVEYSYFVDLHPGDWHTGLKMMFQERYLYDLPAFNDSLFKRQDLAWMKHSYIMLLQFAWDKQYYQAKEKKYTFYKSIFEYDSLMGGYDIFTLWPTWPRLGLDQRNQWDMYRDLPGGLSELRKQADFLHSKGKKFFISYNPWDENTRKEDQLAGMEKLLKQTNADGVVLDTKGSSSFELQATADRVRKGIIMYSEGMAVPKDMPGIVSGRVHDALVLPPPLNLNKFVKPDFAIFRVLQLADDRIHREVAIAFFNGYGVEINTMRQGRPTWIAEEYTYLGRTTKILRENSSVFHNYKFTPLIQTLPDSVYVNRWEGAGKMLYTIYSNRPQGYSGPLLKTPIISDSLHYIDLWNHQEIIPSEDNGDYWLDVTMDPYERSCVDTRKEGSVGCIAAFGNHLTIKMGGEYLDFSANRGDKIVLTGSNPTYSSKQYTFSALGNAIPYRTYFPVTSEKIVVQLFEKEELIDERVIPLHNETPVLISTVKPTPPASSAPDNMVLIPEGDFKFYTFRDPNSADPFIALPDYSDTTVVHMPKYFMDKFPVTNYEYKVFIKKSQYFPRDTTNYLKHWKGGNIPEGEEMNPVVYINMDDAKAYAEWAYKRLPTEREWQYAAQGVDMRKYPWGNAMDSTKCNYNLNHSTPVGAFPQGASPFGVEDMVGNVWQLTTDVYDIGSYYYTILKGGSYYRPTSSIWYVTGGPLPVYHPQMLLLLSPGLDRNATVGFRCVRDAK